LYGVGLLTLGVFAPGLVGAPTPAQAGTIGMRHEKFAVDTVTIHRGDTLTFVNDSGWLHVIGPGDDGRLGSQPGAPNLGQRGAFVSESGQRFVSGPWNTPGTYHITCSLHPEMNITIIVTG
jgi:plastocyanin